MKIHYFQRYHTKENVATANTMLLLSRLYQYSTDKFFRFLNSLFFPENFEPEIVFRLQEKSSSSVPDATITQESFKVVVETKMSDWFYTDQLERHLLSFDFNVRENLYYDNIERGFRAHRYLGLYKNKSVRAVGEVIAIITGKQDQNGTFTYQAELGELTEERKKAIERAILDSKKYGYDLDSTRFFFVKQFYETDFRKSTPRAPMGTRVFDLTTVLGSTEIPDTEQLAQILSQKTWE